MLEPLREDGRGGNSLLIQTYLIVLGPKKKSLTKGGGGDRLGVHVVVSFISTGWPNSARSLYPEGRSVYWMKSKSSLLGERTFVHF